MQKKEYIYPKIEVLTLLPECRVMKNFDISNTTDDPESPAPERRVAAF